jgi:protein involved in sex pheromone biosynthesis
MKKRSILIILSAVVALSGCIPLDNLQPRQEEVVKEGGEEETVFKTPKIKTHDKFYQSLIENQEGELTYNPGESRGEITGGVDNRIDVDELETGLMRLAQGHFDVENYFFQEGQFIDNLTIRNWLTRSSVPDDKLYDSNSEMEQKGLNPALPDSYHEASVDEKKGMEENNPKVLSYILEQNYLVSRNDQLKVGGIAIALSFHSTYYYRVEDSEGRLHDGNKKLDEDKLKADAKEIAQQVIKRIRQDPEIPDVPIVIGLYIEEEHGAVVPGNFFVKATVGKGTQSIGDWKDVNDKYYYFPSTEATEDHRDDSSNFNVFKSKIQEYYPNFIGVIGKGLYRNGELTRMTIEIPMQFKGKAEVISFTQYITYLVQEYYPDEVIRVYISSSLDNPESLIIKDPGEEKPTVHIYRQ